MSSTGVFLEVMLSVGAVGVSVEGKDPPGEVQTMLCWATQRQEWVFNGGVMSVPWALCLKWSGGLSCCFRITSFPLPPCVYVFLIPAAGHWTPTHASLLVSGIPALPLGLRQPGCFKGNCGSHEALWHPICEYEFFTVSANLTLWSEVNKIIMEEKYLSYKENS